MARTDDRSGQQRTHPHPHTTIPSTRARIVFGYTYLVHVAGNGSTKLRNWIGFGRLVLVWGYGACSGKASDKANVFDFHLCVGAAHTHTHGIVRDDFDSTSAYCIMMQSQHQHATITSNIKGNIYIYINSLETS